MSALLNREEFREFLQAHAADRFQRGCTIDCPLAKYLTWITNQEDLLHPAQVFSDHYYLPRHGHNYMLPLWAKNFVGRFDSFMGEGISLTGSRALTLLLEGPEDEDDDEHPGRAMLDESPPHEPDEASPDYDEELEDSEAEPDYEEDGDE